MRRSAPRSSPRRGEWTWAQTAERTRRLAAVLRAHGLGHHGTSGDPRWSSPHDHVALYLYNGHPYLEGMLGAWKARCAPFNVNYRYVADELRYLLDDASSAAIVVQDSFTRCWPRCCRPCPHRRRWCCRCATTAATTLLPGAIEYEAALAAADPRTIDDVAPSWSGDDLYLCYTGGTTGMPKARCGARRLRGRRARRTASRRRRFRLARRAGVGRHGRLRALPARRWMHGAAHWNALSCWLAGGTVVMQSVVDHFDPADVLATSSGTGTTSLLVVGDPMARPLLGHVAPRRRSGRARDLSSLRHCSPAVRCCRRSARRSCSSCCRASRSTTLLGFDRVRPTGRGHDPTRVDRRATSFEPSPTTTVLSEDLTRRVEPGTGELGWLAQTAGCRSATWGPRTHRTHLPTGAGGAPRGAGDRAVLAADGRIELFGRDSVCINTGGEKVFAEEVETAVEGTPRRARTPWCAVVPRSASARRSSRSWRCATARR